MFLCKELIVEDEWTNMVDVIPSSGGLFSNWKMGALLLMKTLARQLLGLLVVLHSRRICARVLRWRDIWVKFDPATKHVHMRVASLRYAAMFADKGSITMPSLAGSADAVIAPEFFK
jgi:hypothetical protein